MVEDIEKRREPLPLAAVYFISPTPSSVSHLVADFENKPLYPSVHIFFSSGVTQDAVDRIKRSRVRLNNNNKGSSSNSHDSSTRGLHAAKPAAAKEDSSCQQVVMRLSL